MKPQPRPLRWLALGLAAWLGIGCAEHAQAPAGHRPPDRTAGCIDRDTVGDLDPRRPC